MNKVRVWMAAGMVAAVVGLIYAAGTSKAGGNKEIVATVDKIADAIKSGDMDTAKKLAAAAKKYDLEDVMDLFKTVKKDGRGWKGAKPTDGIEAKIREVARDGDKNIAKNTAIYEEIGPVTAAIAMIAEAKAPEKDSGKKLKKNWIQWSQDVQEGAVALAKAAKSKSAADTKTAMTKINNACNACHSDFRN
jgi:hypothetical protein